MRKSEAIKTRTIPFVFSDESRDSYGTVIPASAWDLTRFNRLGVALYNHSSYGNDPDNVIGRARAWVEGKQLLGEITFEPAELNPKAEKVFQKLLAGTLRGCSVGFRQLERGHYGEGEEAAGGKHATYYYGRCELLEISVTPIPANANAKVRSEGDETDTNAPQSHNSYVLGEIRNFDPETLPDEPDAARGMDELTAAQARAALALGRGMMARVHVVSATSTCSLCDEYM